MRLRRGFMGLTLGFLLLWPPVQHGLHHAFRVSAWRLFGLGVYARPKLDVSLEVHADGEVVELRSITPPAHDALVRLLDRSRELGTLADPTEAGCRVARERAAQTVVIRRFEHDLGADGLVRPHVREWTVRRGACEGERERSRARRSVNNCYVFLLAR